ncbi:hypothetical protein [Thermoplasma volcanium GSS1]|uniref:Amidohydrolase-related domain-containing protein n=1 Tax=Thermoplasma volcanium (strain ATCC 51530 / DSM 4299 / JCM 9571 / NBRC 15438 / GSS1) TaxID=273116 RepID=Q97BE1_THEVO|nr:amidohydrolase family protein [Thermoplasma volcanium]BAB59657.1 hypothetical protein [Thermoplasma volcanium GSS1]
MSIAISNAIIVTQNDNRDVYRGNVKIDGNKIQYVGKDEVDGDILIDGTNKVLMPGLINTHAHVGMSASKGLFDDVDLDSFLKKTFEYDSDRTSTGIFNSAKLGMYEMIGNGITAFVDLYYSEDIIAKAAEEIGIRAFLSWVTLDKELTTQIGDPVENAENFIRNHVGNKYVVPSVGVQGIYVANDDTFRRAMDLAEKYGTILHMHLSETRKEVYDAVKKLGERPIEHLHNIGILNKRVLAAHCVWATYHEVRLLSKDGVNVSWNSISNFKLGTGGIPPIPEMMRENVNVTIGTDSNGSNNSLDMFQAMKFSAISVKNYRWDASLMKAQEILDMATRNAARALQLNAGSIEVGKLADVVLLDATIPSMIPTNEANAVSNIVYSSSPQNVDTVIIDGEIKKINGKILGFHSNKFTNSEFK